MKWHVANGVAAGQLAIRLAASQLAMSES